MNNMTAADAEVTRLETMVNEAAQDRKDLMRDTRGGTAGGASSTESTDSTSSTGPSTGAPGA
jgi:hypothetical protein